VHAPPVLILDEPTNGLDPRASRQVQALLRAQAEAGVTIFLSTHLLDVAERLCHRLGIIHAGRLAALGTAAELKTRGTAGSTLEEIFLQTTSPEDVP
jgi:ABC-2 type transport system ATP-binding protein